MQNAYVVTGNLTDGRTVTLNEALPVLNGRVRVVVELIDSPPPQRPIQEVMAEIYERQRQRGHKPRTKEEVDADLQAERDSWDNE